MSVMLALCNTIRAEWRYMHDERANRDTAVGFGQSRNAMEASTEAYLHREILLTLLAVRRGEVRESGR